MADYTQETVTNKQNNIITLYILLSPRLQTINKVLSNNPVEPNTMFCDKCLEVGQGYSK